METNREDRWIVDRLAAIEPRWRPNFAHGRELLDAKLAERTHLWSWWVATVTTATLCVAVLAFPGTRALAQEIWYRLVLSRVDVVRVDLSKLPLRLRVTTNGLEQGVQDVYEAEQKAGFRPDLPPPAVMDMVPGITVSGPIMVEQTIHVRDMESALGKMGASGVQVPVEWEGMQLRVHIGPMVTANYPDNVQIVQAQPIELSVPSGFSLEYFTEVAFRSIGVSPWEARAIARKFAANPSWLLDVPADKLVNIQEVALQAGPALLIEDLDDKGNVERATVIRSTSERLYSVSSKSPELSVKIMNALP